MIKKILWLLVVVFSCIWFSSATFQTVWLLKQNSSINNQYSLWFLKGWTVLTEFLWQSKSVLALDSNVLFWWYPDWRPYFYWPSWQWFFIYYDSCPEIVYTWDNFVFDMSQCSRSLISWTDYKDLFKWFFSTIKDSDFVFYEYRNQNDGWMGNYSFHYYSTDFCWSSSEIHKTLCFDYNDCYYWWPYGWHNRCTMYDGGWFENNLWYNNLSFWNIPISEIWYAPWTINYDNNWFIPWDWDTFWSWNTEIIPSDYDSYVSYYEELFWRNENMCYVWVWDSYLDVPYWSGGISFAEWTWSTIFWLYYHLYDTFWNWKIANVWSFINTWVNNYTNVNADNWYYIQYNWPDTNTTVVYTWSFPFLNQPVAIYFMADYISSYFDTPNAWKDIAFYCDLKLNEQWYKNWSLDINDVVDQMPNVIINWIKDYTNSKNKGKNWYSTPDLWSGSIWWNLVQSWYNIPKDLNPTELFSDFYWKINWLITNFNPATRDWIIPLWIIYPMLFLILFRIMRH